MNKKAIFGVLSAFAVISMLCGVAGAQSTNVATDSLSIQGLTISPTPVVAGDNITISFNLFNSYSQSLSDISLWVSAQNPIINVSPAYSTYLSGIGTGQYGGVVADRFTYTLHIPSTLPAGDYEIDVIANYQTTEEVSTGIAAQAVMPIYIYVYGKPQLSLNVYPTGRITPGEDFPATLTVVNSGTDTARNVTVELLNSTYFKPDGASTFSFGILDSGASASATATIFTDQNVTGGINYVNATVSYATNEGTHVSNVVRVPLNVLQNTAKFLVTNVTGKVQAGATYAPVTFTVKNTGNEEATSVEFSLQTVYPVTPVNPDVFLESIGPGQTANLTFYVQGNSNGNTGQYPVTLYAQWNQPNGAANQQFNGSADYYVPVEGKVGLFTAANEDYFIAAAVAIVALIAVRAARARAKKKGINSRK